MEKVDNFRKRERGNAKVSPLPGHDGPCYLATSVGDLVFLRNEDGGFCPNPTEDNPIRIGFVGERPEFDSVDYYAPDAPNKFDIHGNNPDHEPMEFDGDGLCISPEEAKGCFRRDGEDLLMVGNAIAERVWPKRDFLIVAVGKRAMKIPCISGIKVSLIKDWKSARDTMPQLQSDPQSPPRKRYWFVGYMVNIPGRLTQLSGNLIGMEFKPGESGGLSAIRRSIAKDYNTEMKNVIVLNISPLSEEEYGFLKD